jgi:ribulose-phosphate 3-epimerase
MASSLSFTIGLKTDPILYRYSFDWLFDLLADEGVSLVQLGSFFELYQLEDAYFTDLRERAESRGLRIASVFTAHRELGGFFAGDPAWERVARNSFERLIEVGSLVGAAHVGSNPGAVHRDRMHLKPEGIACYLKHMRELLVYAGERGVECLTIEPMSCLAEPPTLPDELASMAADLDNCRPSGAARVGYCADTSHGYADESGQVVWSHLELLEASIPYMEELHLKNSDAIYHSTFGFDDEERAAGVIDLREVVRVLEANADKLPRKEIPAYLELPGPKLGRDYSDVELESALRASLRHCKQELMEHHERDNESGGTGKIERADRPASAET